MEKQQPDAYNRSNEGTRIPLSLQAVFLSGNRGQEVNTPPPDASAMKLFTVHHNNAQGSSRWPPFRSWSSIASFSRNTVAPVSVSTEKDTKMSFVRKVKRSKVSVQQKLTSMHMSSIVSSKSAYILNHCSHCRVHHNHHCPHKTILKV